MKMSPFSAPFFWGTQKSENHIHFCADFGEQVTGTNETLVADAVCLLDVPVNKTSTSFTKPVDRVVGEAIAAWEKVRPQGIKLLDAKTGELVDFLFLFRLTVIGKGYLNRILIPVLCSKAGVPTADVRGNITSHRARSTIASQLFNAKEPMTLNATPTPMPGDLHRGHDKQDGHHGERPPGSQQRQIVSGVEQSHESTNRTRFLVRCLLAALG
jgi:hypothetical protein